MTGLSAATINYICPVVKNRPNGGAKVIHRHAEVLASMGVPCLVFQAGNIHHRYDWFESRAPVRTDDAFDPRRDFMVIPEVWAGDFGREALKKGFHYAIFAQGGYNIMLAREDCPLADLKQVYLRASLVLCISEDTAAMVRLAYPDIPAERIVRVMPSVGERFSPGAKTKTISYMPRKLPEQARKLRALLALRLPMRWDVAPIDMQSESEVAGVMAKSSIFLSICDQEGFGLPPLEAGLSGALVIGNTGQGGNEYFDRPNFRPIESGNLREFVEEILRGTEEIEAGLLDSAPFRSGIERLRAQYSPENERRHLLDFAERVRGVFAP